MIEVAFQTPREDHTLALLETLSTIIGTEIRVVVDPSAPEHCPCGCTAWRGWHRKEKR